MSWKNQVTFELRSFRRLLFVRELGGRDWRQVVADMPDNRVTMRRRCYVDPGCELHCEEDYSRYADRVISSSFLPKPTLLFLLRLCVAVPLLAYLIWKLSVGDSPLYYLTTWCNICVCLLPTTTCVYSLLALCSWYREYRAWRKISICRFVDKCKVFFRIPAYQIARLDVHISALTDNVGKGENDPETGTSVPSLKSVPTCPPIRAIRDSQRLTVRCFGEENNSSRTRQLAEDGAGLGESTDGPMSTEVVEVEGVSIEKTRSSYIRDVKDGRNSVITSLIGGLMLYYTVAMEAIVCVTFLYWCLEMPMKRQFSHWTVELQHGPLGLLLYLIAICERIPVPFPSFLALELFGISYSFFSLIMYSSFDVVVYETLDWKGAPVLASLVCFANIFLLIPIVHLAYWTLFRHRTSLIFTPHTKP